MSPIILTNSEPVEVTIFALFTSADSNACNFLNSCAFPIKYLFAASLTTNLMASASPSAKLILLFLFLCMLILVYQFIK
jgi:hypothetical protein